MPTPATAVGDEIRALSAQRFPGAADGYRPMEFIDCEVHVHGDTAVLVGQVDILVASPDARRSKAKEQPTHRAAGYCSRAKQHPRAVLRECPLRAGSGTRLPTR